MAHNIMERDGMFTVRQPAWHGLGAVLPDYPTREEAQRIAHPWEPIAHPVYRDRVEVTAEGPTTVFEELDGYNHIVRSDTGESLGVVTATYQTVTNSEMYDIAEAIEAGDPTSVKYETGGSLKNGAKVWLLLRLAEPLTIKGDPRGATIPYYALQNAHDGSGAFRGQATMTRIVCDNTSQIADMDSRARGTEFVFKHTKNIRSRIEDARMALAGWRSGLDAWKALNDHLILQRVTPEQRTMFVEKFIPSPPPHLVTERVTNNVMAARDQLMSVYLSQTCEGIDLTAYGLVQGAVEYAEHHRKAASKESLFQRSYLSRSDLTARAVDLAQTAVLA